MGLKLSPLLQPSSHICGHSQPVMCMLLISKRLETMQGLMLPPPICWPHSWCHFSCSPLCCCNAYIVFILPLRCFLEVLTMITHEWKGKRDHRFHRLLALFHEIGVLKNFLHLSLFLTHNEKKNSFVCQNKPSASYYFNIWWLPEQNA